MLHKKTKKTFTHCKRKCVLSFARNDGSINLIEEQAGNLWLVLQGKLEEDDSNERICRQRNRECEEKARQ